MVINRNNKYVYQSKNIYTFRTNNFGNDENMLGTFIFHILEIPNYHSMIQFQSDSIGPQDNLY